MLETDENGGYKQLETIGEYFKRTQGRRNKKQLLLRPQSEFMRRLEEIKLLKDFKGSNQELINLLIDEVHEKIIKDRIFYEDPPLLKLIKEDEEAEKIHNDLVDKGYNPDERRRIIKSVKDERMKERLEKLEDEWLNQHHLSLKRRGRLRGYR